jgi:hypothetical protein
VPGLDETLSVSRLKFGFGTNSFKGDVGDIFVTDLPADVSALRLSQIGLRGDKKQFAIQFREIDAFNSGARVRGVDPHIFRIPGGCTIVGVCTVRRVR